MIAATKSAPFDGADLETLAAVTLHEDAKQARQMARQMKKDAQRDRLELMQQGVRKLREMAWNALGTGIWQGVAGIASAAMSAASIKGGSLYEAAGKLADAAGKVDPFQIQNQFLGVERGLIDTRAEVAGNRAQEQSDFEAEGRRLESSASQLAQKLGDARHAAALAAIKV